MAKIPNRYEALIEWIFHQHYRIGDTEFVFLRTEFEKAAVSVSVRLPRNLGDVLYAFRYRAALPVNIQATAPAGKEWIIRPAGKGRYAFALVAPQVIVPNSLLEVKRLPESTPALVTQYAQNDEQALLAILRYNRLIDIFTGVTCYSLQSHLRAAVPGLGQIETDELYVGLDKHGTQYVIPVQAKGGTDRLGIVQIEQDVALCSHRFPQLTCIPIAAQFMAGGAIALFRFTKTDEGIRLVEERHYQLEPRKSI